MGVKRGQCGGSERRMEKSSPKKKRVGESFDVGVVVSLEERVFLFGQSYSSMLGRTDICMVL